MALSPEYHAASRRLRDIGRELLRLKRQQLLSALKSDRVKDVLIDETIATLKIKRIRVVLADGKELVHRASAIEDLLVQVEDGLSSRIRELEQEWSKLNKKWHLYP